MYYDYTEDSSEEETMDQDLDHVVAVLGFADDKTEIVLSTHSERPMTGADFLQVLQEIINDYMDDPERVFVEGGMPDEFCN
jgi:hypothetical protein